MRKITAALLLCLISLYAVGQTTSGDRIIGVWLSEEKDGKIEIYKTGNKYSGKIVGGKDLYNQDGTLQKDSRNPDKSLQSRDLLNLTILTDFIYENEEWTDGKIYDPKSGKIYSCVMKLNNDKLQLRGYVGVSLFGKTTVWERDK